MFTTIKTMTRIDVRNLLIEARRNDDHSTEADCRKYLQGDEFGEAAKRLVGRINDRKNAGAAPLNHWRDD